MFSWTGRFSIVKISALLKLIYRCNAILIKIPTIYVVHIIKVIIKLYEKAKALGWLKRIKCEESLFLFLRLPV